MSTPIDLRSDTVTRPTEAMRRAMSEAEVGDDWYGDDPTVNRLQDRAAELTGKEAAIFVATGTMANQIALHAHCRSGHLVVCEASAHVTSTEAGSSAVLSGIAFHRIPAERGLLTADPVAEALVPDRYGVDVVDLVSLENSHQVGGGSVLPVEEVRAIGKVAADAGVAVYLDGARLFNASVASGTPVGEYAAETDALMFSLSKGLGAPIGSVLCGTAGFVKEARRLKILFGGGWRQAGVMAAAGLVALAEGPQRLHEDHQNARRLAEGLAEVTPDALDPSLVETNIVFVDTALIGMSPFEALDRLRDEGILATMVSGRLRFVTHRDVTAEEVEETISAWRRVAAGDRRGGGDA